MNQMRNENYEKEEVLNLGGEYFDDLIQRVEEHGIKVYKTVKEITERVRSGLPISNKQATVLMNFKDKFAF